MNQAETYKKSVYEYNDNITPPKYIWRRYYGKAGYDRQGRRMSKTMYLGFEDGSRLRVYRGGTVTVI